MAQVSLISVNFLYNFTTVTFNHLLYHPAFPLHYNSIRIGLPICTSSMPSHRAQKHILHFPPPSSFSSTITDVFCEVGTKFRVIKSRRIRWAGHVARMGEKRGVHSVLVGKPEGKETPSGDPGLDGRIILRWIFREWDVGGYGLDRAG